MSSFGKERVLAHELGHAILHKDNFLNPKHTKFGIEANIFAANLLIGDDYIGKYDPESESDQELYIELLNYI